MGLARIFGFIWRRWGDYQSAVALLDLLDAKTWIFPVLGFIGMTFLGATEATWSAPTVIFVALGAAS
jgi:hypothetical protein